MPGRYLTEEQLKQYNKSETVIDVPEYTAAILAAEELIDGAVGRRIALAHPTESSARMVRGQGGDTLLLDDFVELVSLTVDGVALTNGTDFVLEPINGLSRSGEQRPYDSAIKAYGSWPRDRLPTISVVARWDWPIIPHLAVEACKVAAKAILDGRDIRFGLVGLAESGAVTEREAKVVRDFIRNYSGWKAVPIA